MHENNKVYSLMWVSNFSPHIKDFRYVSNGNSTVKIRIYPWKYPRIYPNIHKISRYYPDNIQISRYYPWIISGYFMDMWIQRGYKSLTKISRYYPWKISRKYPKYPFLIQILSMDTRDNIQNIHWKYPCIYISIEHG